MHGEQSTSPFPADWGEDLALLKSLRAAAATVPGEVAGGAARR